MMRLVAFFKSLLRRDPPEPPEPPEPHDPRVTEIREALQKEGIEPPRFPVKLRDIATRQKIENHPEYYCQEDLLALALYRHGVNEDEDRAIRFVRIAAVLLLRAYYQDELKFIARNDPDERVREEAIKKINDNEFLRQLTSSDKYNKLKDIIKAKLDDHICVGVCDVCSESIYSNDFYAIDASGKIATDPNQVWGLLCQKCFVAKVCEGNVDYIKLHDANAIARKHRKIA
jgi:hypothetical protein